MHGRSEYDGTGIGLSIARKIAWRHNGNITAVGMPGEGDDLTPLLRCILDHVPAPEVDAEGPLQAIVTNLDASDYLGRLAIGRVMRGALRKGERVGYAGVWECPEDMNVGVAAIGYGDGYPRHAGAGTPVLVNGVRASLVGRVSMDLVTIDLRAHPDAKIGDTVVLWGRGLPVEEVAMHADTIGYELTCGVTRRVRFVEDES